MLEKLQRAIKELAKHHLEFETLSIDEVVASDKVRLENKVMYCETLNQALVYLINHLNGEEVKINSHFKTFGTMIDLSRNAVFNGDYMKEVIRKKALMGVNRIMMYIEDVYFVEEEPYFGYMRGRYTKDEIKGIVDYASLFDVEIIPCIQTLGHMGQFLRWGHNAKLKDLQTVLIADTDQTRTFIETLIKTAREMFKTDKIHVGMDETFGLGFGMFYKKFGYVPQYEIFVKHLNFVNDVCLKHGFKDVMIWSDMFFRISSEKEEYYDLSVNISQELKDAIPENVQLVYWDYYNWKESIVDGMLQKHQEFNNKIIMASGTWIWTKLVYDKIQTDRTAKLHIDSCYKTGIDEIYLTQWNDDGAPCNYETSFLGVFEMAGYALTEERAMSPKVFNRIMKADYQEALLVSKLNEAPLQTLPLLWDDPLNGIFLNNEGARDGDIIEKSLTFLNSYKQELASLSGDSFELNHVKVITDLLITKVETRGELVKRYKGKETLLPLIEKYQLAITQVEALLDSYREMWLGRYKAFGLDVMQSRLSTLSYRFKETIRRIEDYEAKRLTTIDELDEPVGPYQQIRMNHMNIAYSSIHVLGY